MFQIQETNKLVTSVLDVQPRVGSGGTGKSNDEIVAEIAQSISEKIMDKLDIENAKPEMFEVNTLYGLKLMVFCTKP